MAHTALPAHPTLVHPITGKPLRAIFVRRDGRVVWPVMGGDETGAGGAGEAGGAGAGSGGSGSGAGTGTGGAGTGAGAEHGFPPNTPLEQMTVDQREAYWKFQSRKHEERSKAFGNLTPEQLAELQDKAKKFDEVERERLPAQEKAVAEAKEQAKKDAAAAFAPRLVKAEFKAALTGRVPAEELDQRVATIVDPLDTSKFLTSSGDVDAAKVATFVNGIAPTKATRSGPPNHGQGHRDQASGGFGASGRAEAQKRFGDKSTAKQ